MSELSTVNALRSALEPVEALRGEHSQLEQWVRESFASLEQLHSELDERESELSRREAELAQSKSDLSESAESTTIEENLPLKAEVEHLRRQLDEANVQSQELRNECAEQLDVIEQMDRAVTELRAESTADKALLEELELALAEQREQATHQHGSVASELNDIRHALETQRQTLEDLVDAAVLRASIARETDVDGNDGNDDASARLAEIRQRAQARNATNRRNA